MHREGSQAYFYIVLMDTVKVVLEGCCRCPDSHDLSAYHHLYDLGRHI